MKSEFDNMEVGKAPVAQPWEKQNNDIWRL